jgi:hypothetical protein
VKRGTVKQVPVSYAFNENFTSECESEVLCSLLPSKLSRPIAWRTFIGVLVGYTSSIIRTRENKQRVDNCVADRMTGSS